MLCKHSIALAAIWILKLARWAETGRSFLLVLCFLGCSTAIAEPDDVNRTPVPSLQELIVQLQANEAILHSVSVTLDHSRFIAARDLARLPIEGFFVGRWSYDSNGRTRYDGIVEETSSRGTRTKLTSLAFDGKVARWLETSRDSHFSEASLDSQVTTYGINPREITTSHLGKPISQVLTDKGAPSIETVQLDGKPVLLASTRVHTSGDGASWQSRFWLDPAMGMAVVRRSAFYRTNPHSQWHEYTSVRSSEFQEVGAGVWLPTHYCYEHIEKDPENGELELSWRYEGGASNWRINESFEDRLFTIVFDDDLEVNDYRIEATAANPKTAEKVEKVKDSDTDDDSKTEAAKERTGEREPLYDPQADAEQLIAAAVTRARRDGKNVIVEFGGNWCGWCYRLYDFFHEKEGIATLLNENYELVLVDVNSNRDIFLRYDKANEKHGFPFLTVLDGEGNVLINQNSAELEQGESYSVSAVARFLSQWQPERLDARTVLKAAKSDAKQENKLILVHLGAPRCGWCRRLDDFLEQHADLFGKDFLNVKIDTLRMRHGDEVAAEIRGDTGGGIPWFAILEADGSVLATSDGPTGNVGFPADDAEINHFMKMLSSTVKHMDQIDLATIERELKSKQP
jgi:thiol-disulfide isomerase/thioredoxin